MDALLELLQKKIMSQTAEKSDVIVLLHGDRFDRCPKVLELYNAHYAPLILLSGNNILVGKGQRPGQEEVPLDEIKRWFTDQGVTEGAIMVDDHSMNTRDQALHVIDRALALNWKKMLLVGSTDHQLRAFLTFLKRVQEINWQGRIVNQGAHFEMDYVPGGRSQTVREILDDEIKKSKLYKEHLASPQSGIKCLGHKLSCRLANEADAQMLFRWRNDPSTYMYFFTPEPVTWEDHLAWLNGVLKDKDRTLYLFEDEGIPVGQIRFDLSEEKDGSAELSISIAKDFRACGYGIRGLRIGIQQYTNDYPALRHIRAQVKKENIASLGLFAQAGFKKVREKEGVCLFNYDVL
ncbi:MAG: GNAT family N-acetyltransferase [Candidatus Magasanikbacteria bacterium]|nr:GNAT family N-acetyltransferase [Candidatus Magasanikbacteria bacterium]